MGICFCGKSKGDGKGKLIHLGVNRSFPLQLLPPQNGTPPLSSIVENFIKDRCKRSSVLKGGFPLEAAGAQTTPALIFRAIKRYCKIPDRYLPAGTGPLRRIVPLGAVAAAPFLSQ